LFIGFSLLLRNSLIPLLIFLALFGVFHDLSPLVMKRHYCRFMNSNALFAEEIQSFLMKIWNKNEGKNIYDWRKETTICRVIFSKLTN
jgi:hypothetical protein